MHGWDPAAHPVIVGDEGVVTLVEVGEGLRDRYRRARFAVQPAVDIAPIQYRERYRDHGRGVAKIAVGYTLPGLLAEYILIGEEVLAAGCFLPLPDDGLPAAHAAIAEPISCIISSHAHHVHLTQPDPRSRASPAAACCRVASWSSSAPGPWAASTSTWPWPPDRGSSSPRPAVVTGSTGCAAPSASVPGDWVCTWSSWTRARRTWRRSSTASARDAVPTMSSSPQPTGRSSKLRSHYLARYAVLDLSPVCPGQRTGGHRRAVRPLPGGQHHGIVRGRTLGHHRDVAADGCGPDRRGCPHRPHRRPRACPRTASDGASARGHGQGRRVPPSAQHAISTVPRWDGEDERRYLAAG